MEKRKKYQKFYLPLKIIGAIALAGGAATVAAVLPGLAFALTPFIRGKKREERERRARNRVNFTINRLKERGLIKEDSNGKLLLTEKGQKLFYRYQLQELTIKKPRRWDGKWRLVAFDVWETRRTSRDLLRKTLQNFGFMKLQRSLWVYPYDCEELIGLLRTSFKLSSAIQYMVVDRMDRDYGLRKSFNLPIKEHIL